MMQLGFPMMSASVSAEAYGRVARRQYVLRKALENVGEFRAGFYEWLQENLHVWEGFESAANDAWAAGVKHFGARSIWETMRYQTAIRERSGDFKLNNNYAPAVARLYLVLHPDRAGFFTTRSGGTQ